MHRKLALIGGTAAMLLATAVPAMAHHPHIITTPGTCVDRAGAGFGTGEEHDHTSFHERLHMGTPGTFAFAHDANPVSITGKTFCP